MSDRSALERQRDRALDDLMALQAQEAASEIDSDTAARLRSRYESEAAAAIRALGAAPAAAATPGRSSRRVIVGVSVFAVAAALVVAGLVRAVEPRQDAAPGTTIDLDSITTEEMEAVVAANPDIVPMRLALARRYVEAGDFSAALPHYFEVLERDERNPEALMYMGWMTYLSGDAGTGVALLEQSLQEAPGDLLATWLLANARYHGLDDRAGAVPLLEAVIASGEAPADIVAEAERMIAEAGQ